MKINPLGLIFYIMLMVVIGITILNPIAPYIVRRFSNAALMVSMITIIYASGQFIAAPLMGKQVTVMGEDRYYSSAFWVRVSGT